MVGVDVGVIRFLGLSVEGVKYFSVRMLPEGSVVVLPRAVDGVKPSSKGMPRGVGDATGVS